MNTNTGNAHLRTFRVKSNKFPRARAYRDFLELASKLRNCARPGRRPNGHATFTAMMIFVLVYPATSDGLAPPRQ